MTQNTLDIKKGIIYGILASLLWGSYPLWYKPLQALSAYDLLSWRVIFAEICVILFIIFSGRASQVKEVVKRTKPKYILIVSAILGVWWWLYIYGIMTNRILEVAFGYFLSPIMSMAVSRFIFKEATTKWQKVAIFTAISGVVLMALYSLNLHSFPWIAITIGFCYSFYGIFKKQVSGDSLIVQAMEIGVLLPFAILFTAYTYFMGNGHVFLQNINTDILIVCTGIITVLPLLWYSRAAKNLTVIALSFIQFIPPTCNFLLAYFIYGELVQPLKFYAFCLIWAALAIFMWNLIKSKKR